MALADGKGNPVNFQNVAEVFDRLYIDSSGGITLDELEKVVVEQGYSIRVAKLLMAELDVNKDGGVDKEEWVG